jgi:hypothetical protein
MRIFTKSKEFLATGLVLAFTACQDPFPAPSSTEILKNEAGGPTILYSGVFSDSGTLTIVSEPSGQIDYAVQARIGSKAQQLMDLNSTQPTLADLYRSLHEGTTEVPDIVEMSSQRIEAQKAVPGQVSRVSPAARPLVKTASESAFKTGYCRDFVESSVLWVLSECRWTASANHLVAYYLWSDGVHPDRVYAWNNSPWTATLSLINASYYTDPAAYNWKPTLQPYWVTWFQWGGSYNKAQPKITLPTGKSGELGLTVHYWEPWVQ